MIMCVFWEKSLGLVQTRGTEGSKEGTKQGCQQRRLQLSRWDLIEHELGQWKWNWGREMGPETSERKTAPFSELLFKGGGLSDLKLWLQGPNRKHFLWENWIKKIGHQPETLGTLTIKIIQIKKNLSTFFHFLEALQSALKSLGG